MDQAKTTPKDFFLWAGAMISLYASVFAFISLVFSYIDYALPDPLSYVQNPYEGMIPFAMASVIVLVPVCVLLMSLIRRDIVRDSSRATIWVRRWALYLVLFVAGATLIVDIITLLVTFLSGSEITVRFLLKILIVLLVAGAGFLHFFADLAGYWQANPGKARLVGGSVVALCAITVALGFFILGTPYAARLSRIDQTKEYDLQQIQSQISNFYQVKQKLPTSLDELQDSTIPVVVPTDPQTGAPYIYRAKSATTFELCATFNRPSLPTQGRVSRPFYGGESWQHGSGEVCFTRTIDPDRYPPINKDMYRTY